MRKSIYLLTTTPSSHTHRFHPLPLATPASCSPHLLATPIHSTHSPQLSSILLTCAKFKVWMTIVESGWNVWVWLVGVVSRRRVWLVGVGWNLWVWLLGVVVRRYIDFLILLIPTPLVSVLLLLLYLFFFTAASLLFVHFVKCFSFFIYIYPYQQTTIIHSIYIYIYCIPLPANHYYTQYIYIYIYCISLPVNHYYTQYIYIYTLTSKPLLLIDTCIYIAIVYSL